MCIIVTTFLSLCIISGAICNEQTQPGFGRGRMMKEDSSCAVPALTMAGSVCGVTRVSYNGALYASFRGVPYARPPLGELRFMAPQPLESWDGYLDASIDAPGCPQPDEPYGPILQPNMMSEDCLYINVHVPAAALPVSGKECSGAACLPVLVFVHGGGFSLGSGNSDINGPEYMIDQNIVLVNINYRLGLLGFLSLNSTSVPGNAGLRDMVAALQWVQTNIRAFGGDPAQVTLMGQSAGASAAHLLSLSEATQGLFAKIILMSGTSGSGFYSTLPSYAQLVTNYLLEYVGINSTDAEEAYRKLNELPYETILDANTKLLHTLDFTAFSPVVETQIDGVIRILDEDPDVLVARGRGRSYPLMVGSTNVECEVLRHALEHNDVMGKISKNATKILPIKLLYSSSDEERKTAAKRMIKSTPTCGTRDDSSWPAAARPLRYQHIAGAAYAVSGLTEEQQSMMQLFDGLYPV